MRSPSRARPWPGGGRAPRTSPDDTPGRGESLRDAIGEVEELVRLSAAAERSCERGDVARLARALRSHAARMDRLLELAWRPARIRKRIDSDPRDVDAARVDSWPERWLG